MHARSLALLLVAVAALAALAFWQLRREDREGTPLAGPLMEGFERGRVRALRIDNLERSLQLRIERRSDGRWMIVDPLEFPVESALLEALFSSLETQRLEPPLVHERSKLRLAPPRAVLEVSEDIGGRTQLTRIEVGEVDIGEQLVYVTRNGELGRSERALDTVLERDLADWRSHYVMALDPRSVVELRREGRLDVPGEAALALALHAVLDGEWRASEPFQALLDARAVGGLVNALASVRAEGFIDAPGPLEFYGLESPTVRLEAIDVHGATQTLRMAPEPQGEMWYAKRDDQPYIYRVSSLYAGLCLAPSQGLVEAALARVARSDVSALEWDFEGRGVKLELVERTWRVSGREGERVVLDAAVADEAAVADALSLVEQARLGGLEFERDLAADQVRGRLVLRASGGELGGDLGALVRTSDGVEGLEYRRDGDRIVARLPAELAALVRRRAQEFQSLVLHKLLELNVSYIELAHAGRTRRWVRDEHGHWERQGHSGEAKQFARYVDRLLSMRATRMLARGEQRLDGALRVSLVTFGGQALEFELGLAQVDGAAAHVYLSDKLFALVSDEPYAGLLALMGAD